MSRITLLVALAFGLVSPVRAAPRAVESEEVESCGDAAESEATAHARAATRHGRRAQRQGGPAQAHIELAHDSIGPSTRIAVVARPRWQLPRRSAPPDDDPLG